MNQKQKRVLVLARDVLNKPTTEDYTPTDDWSDNDWELFQGASVTKEQIRLLETLADGGKIDPENVRAYGHRLLFDPNVPKPFGVTHAAHRILADSQAKNGFFAPIWRRIFHRIVGHPSNLHIPK
jgi:hypothetical protein